MKIGIVQLDGQNIGKVTINQDMSVAIQSSNGEAFGTLEELKNSYLMQEKPVTDASKLDTRLDLPEKPTKGDLRRAVTKWMRDNLQGKNPVRTSDGKYVYFNRDESTNHLRNDGARSALYAKSIPFVADVFQNGTLESDRKGESESHERVNDELDKFYRYRKWVKIDGYELLLEAIAASDESGRLVAINDLIAYNQKIKEKRVVLPDELKAKTNMDNAQVQGYATLDSNNTLDLADLQDTYVPYLHILEVKATNEIANQPESQQTNETPEAQNQDAEYLNEVIAGKHNLAMQSDGFGDKLAEIYQRALDSGDQDALVLANNAITAYTDYVNKAYQNGGVFE